MSAFLIVTGQAEQFISWDDAKATVAALTKATKDAGYPSSVKSK